MDWDLFHPLIRDWFVERFQGPTEPQRLGWPAIAGRTPTLIAAPTGSGKTLAAFLVCIDRLFRLWLEGQLDASTRVVYVSPLKALSNDIRRNLEQPLAEICARAEAAGLGRPEIRAAVRTGDTPAAERQKMLRQPPHILVTTPESLYLVVTSEKARQSLRHVDTLIVDEIHSLARDKRGSHLTVTLERLAHLCEQPPLRIGLSATQRPIDQIASFLCGAASPPCHIVDVGHVRELDLGLEVPPSELAAVCSGEQWGEVYDRLTQLIQQHRSTLVFVNTRRMAERIAHRLTELLGEEAVASHHGSLSREIRLDAEQRLKSGQLKALVATASLEMGIDIGYIDLVCQIGSPRAIATFLQRVGRSGHSLHATPKGRLFPLTRDELLECLALVRSVRRGILDAVEIPVAPLDILAQQIIAAVACDEWTEEGLYALVRRAWPYRELDRSAFDKVLGLVSEGLTSQIRNGAFIHRDRIQGVLRPRRGARLAAITSGGAIPEAPLYRVVTEPEGTYVGEVDEHFAIDSSAGDVFLLGTTSWRITAVRGQEVRVRDAEGAPPTVPFWFGEAPGRTIELSEQLADLRKQVADRLTAPLPPQETRSAEAMAVDWLRAECLADDAAAAQAVAYVAAQTAALGLVPTTTDIVFERFFDESGGMQLVIHAPLGHRINRAWGLALRKRFCRSFDFELQAAATDNGILLSIGPQHSFPIEQLFKMLGPHNGQELLQQALFAVPMFPVRWRWNVSRALAILRFQNGKKIPFFLQRFRADDLLAATFPATVGCLENHHGDIEIPDHPLVQQTIDDCLYEALDVKRWLQVLGDYQAGRVRFIPRDTREPSPFSHELLNANPYAFLDGADLEERRTRAVSTRRSLSADEFRDLSRMDPEAVAQVVADAAPVVRDADELHDVLLQTVLMPAVTRSLDDSLNPETAAPRDLQAARWMGWFEQLARQGRATRVTLRVPAESLWTDGDATSAPKNLSENAHPSGEESPATQPTVERQFWVAVERWPILRAAYADAIAEPPVSLAPDLDTAWSKGDAWSELVRGQMATCGPVTVAQLVARLLLEPAYVQASLEALEGQGLVLRGQFTATETADDSLRAGRSAAQWCDRRLLARIHRLTLEGLRRRIQPVTPHEFMRFLVRHQRWGAGYGAGPAGVREAIAQLAGFETPAAAWERHLLAPRIAQYDPQWLDQLFLAGEITWGRLNPPRREPQESTALAAMTRAMPVALVPRDDLAWLLPPERSVVESLESEGPRQVWEALRNRGALFLNELRLLTRLPREEIEDSLRELASLGLVTSDAFAAVRSIVSRRDGDPTRLSSVGRWSCFPGILLELARLEAESRGQAVSQVKFAAEKGEMTVDGDESERRVRVSMSRVERWCWLLLRRYGVLFRDLLTRETAAPAWGELVPVLRRMELRGEVRGGRFITGVAGEQFATEASVTQLRATRDEPIGDWIVVSAADPLNLSGIVIEGPRIPATHRNLLVLWGGRCVAGRRGGQVEFYVDDLDQATRERLQEALETTRRRHPRVARQSPPVSPPTSGSRSLREDALRLDEPSSQGPPPPNVTGSEKVRKIRERWTQF